MIYLDHELASPPDERTVERMHEVLDARWWPQGAPYTPPHPESTAPLYILAGAHSEDYFVCTASGAESVNHVLWGVYADVTRQTGRHHFLCSSLEGAPTLLGMQRLEKWGCIADKISPAPGGYLTVDQVAEALTPRTALLSLSWAHGLTGVVQPIQEIAALCAERGVLLHLEATHALGRGNFSFQESGAHFLTFDGEPLGAPGGTGGLFIRRNSELPPLLVGGYEQEGMRAGVFSSALWQGLVMAAQLRYAHSDAFCIQSALWRRQFEQVLEKRVGAYSFFGKEARLPHVSLLGFPGITSEALCYHLAARKIYANMGGNRFQQLVHILRGCGVPSPLCHGGLSFAFGPETTQEQVTTAIEHIVESVEALRRCSTHLLKEKGHA